MQENRICMKDYTTFKIGGMASYFSVGTSIEDVFRAIIWCKQHNLPWFILGNGSNILVADEGFPGLVIKLGRDFKKVIFGGNIVDVGAGVLLPALSRHFLAKRWGGFEFMCGIPGSIGGAVRMNAGTRQGEIKNHFISATVLAPDGSVWTMTREEMDFSHRHSCLAESRDIVLSARFKLPYLDKPEHIKKKIKLIIADRCGKQPKIKRNCGSVFKRPPGGKSAGWYIAQAGFKGLRMGDAMVAHEHANWIINLGRAKASDVKNLIQHLRKEVFNKFQISLNREVIYVPEDILGG